MLSFNEAVEETLESCMELLKHFGQGDWTTMPEDLPPIAQQAWKEADALSKTLASEEFEKLLN